MKAQKRFLSIALIALTILASILPLSGEAADAPPAAADPVLEAKMLTIASELRCLVCQNQTIADSHAGLAIDLRNQVREMLRDGKSESQILSYMTDRYGDFVLYRPPLKATTYLLWFGPLLLFAIGAYALIATLRQRAALPDDSFEPEPTADNKQE
jgi:cytochrome c-type biogenesis protein CcmH